MELDFRPKYLNSGDFDPFVVALADTVGFIILPGVLYVSGTSEEQ